ncbi:Sugar kinase of the NBD/HSP70 family, may contain an N-terminal HTH domain [Klenkia soli]|uniref:Sugar kinase of the NBD/HSP70 family, may contain an N-terminal HTH domain n=1 Tax=Klenkia soli TaxID=1052260 RepID=A0A1H0MVZ4_9ACTN|nr:ROK family protein [Klenkia soli]SDO84554.1 Sugar kinase of the NBD/HSP70 family, may contain an N-terminal HTH domain [Klenkia soli]
MTAPEDVEDVALGALDSAHQVALHVLRFGPLPRGAVARAMGLSAGSLTRLSKPLIDGGLLVETEPVTDPATRRPTRPLDVAVAAHRFVGVDVTGTDAWAVLTDLRVNVSASARVTLEGTTPAHIADAVAWLVAELADGPPVGIGVALGGHVDAAGRVVHADFLGWRTPVDLGGLVAERTGAPVVVGNDLACLTRAEHWFGLGREHPSFAVLTVGAGVGYGLVLGDRAVQTPDTSLQLLGHLSLDRSGPRCPEGHRGCASALLTTTALLTAAHLATGTPTTWPQLLADAVDGDVRARRVLDDAAGHLGQLVAVVAGTTGVTQVLLGGEGVDLAVVGHDSLRAAIDEHRDARAQQVELTVRDHDFHVWARGAAGAAVHDFTSSPRWLTAP